MWFESSNEITEILRSSFLAFFILAIPILIPSCLAAREFPAFRLQQYDLHGTSYGTTGSLLNYETRVLPGSHIVTSPRRCYLVKLGDLTIRMYRALLKASVAGIVIIVPTKFSNLSTEIREQIQELEQVLLEESTTIPVYFIHEEPDVLEMYEMVRDSSESSGVTTTAYQTLIQHIHGNGVQLVSGSTIGTPKVVPDAQITSIQGALVGTKSDRSFPVLITSHYDSMSPAADLSFGGDSNGSGSVLLLELARLFSHLYTNQGPALVKLPGWMSKRPSNSLLFLLSGAGRFNYQGTQKYLEDQDESSENSYLQDTRLVICLDSLGGGTDEIFIHVSRSIREGTLLNAFIRNLADSAKILYPEVKVEVVQRKVRTESLLNWEHEKFHLKKISAVTLSSYDHRSNVKTSLLDTVDSVDLDKLTKKAHVIAEALAATNYNVSGIGTAFTGSLSVSKESISSLLTYVASQARSAQLLATKQNSFVQSLRSVLGRYTHETTPYYMKPDKRDANLVFYDATSGTITAYDVKPAVFDLVLSLAIAAYITLVYFAVKNFHLLYDLVSYKVVPGGSNSNTNGASVTQGKVRERARKDD